MWVFIEKTPYSIIIVATVLMILAPFAPMPHVMELFIILDKRHII